MELLTSEHTIAALILFIAYLVRGVSGFGSALLAVPLLAHFLPLTLIVPLLTLLDVFASLIMSHAESKRKNIRQDEIRRLLPVAIIGMVLGIFLLKGIAEAQLLVMLGVVILLFGIRAALRLGGQTLIQQHWAWPAGFLGGMINGIFATGGPPFVIYLTHRIHHKGELRGTFSVLFLLLGTAQTIGFLLAGLLNTIDLWIAFALGIPIALLGLYAGNHIHLAISRETMFSGIGLLLIGSGLSIALQGMHGI